MQRKHEQDPDEVEHFDDHRGGGERVVPIVFGSFRELQSGELPSDS